MNTEELLTEILSEMRHQTDAINRLAASNEALIEAMAESEGVDEEDREPETYMDGSPVLCPGGH